MLTDDLLTEELSAAFRDATAEMTYAGPVPRPRRTPLVLVPAAVAGAAAVILVSGSLGDSPNNSPGDSPSPAHQGSPSTPTALAQPRLVTDTIEFAGYTFRYQREAGEPYPIRVQLVDATLPDGVRKVSVAAPARAWVGTDPKSGDAALYVKAPTRNAGKLFVVLSSTWTQQQLVHLLHTGTPND
jgi:hypothetical protein